MDLDFDKWLGLIETFINAPTWKAVVIIVGIVAICVLMIAKYFYDENKRRKEAFVEAKRIKKEQYELTERLQRDASEAFRLNMDTAFKQDYEDFSRYIKDKKYSSVLMNIPGELHEEVGKHLYREELDEYDRAARIINILKRVSNESRI